MARCCKLLVSLLTAAQCPLRSLLWPRRLSRWKVAVALLPGPCSQPAAGGLEKLLASPIALTPEVLVLPPDQGKRGSLDGGILMGGFSVCRPRPPGHMHRA